MGFLRRIGRAADRVHDAADLSGVAARLNRRRDRPAEELRAAGQAATAVIAGIRRRTATDGDQGDVATLRLEWPTPAGPRVGAVALTGQGERSPGLRLGAQVPVRHDDDSVVPDCALPPGTGIRPVRQPPDPGIDDRWTEDRRLGAWAPDTATVESFTRRTVPLLGIPADSWDIALRRRDGSAVANADGGVPPYVRAYIAPGAEVPVVVDPDHAGRVQVNWPALAQARAGSAGHVDDEVPEGSIAASLRPGTDEEVTSMSGPAADDAPAPVAGPGGDVDGVTLEIYARVQAALQTARVPPAGYDAYAAREFGTPAGGWAAVDAGWQRRIMSDWRVGAAYAEAVEAARKRR